MSGEQHERAGQLSAAEPGGIRCQVSLNPGYEDAGSVCRGDHELVALTGFEVESAAAARLDGGEKLALRFADDKHRPLRLRLKPRVSLSRATELFPTKLYV